MRKLILIQYKASDLPLYSPEKSHFSVCSALAEHPIKICQYKEKNRIMQIFLVALVFLVLLTPTVLAKNILYISQKETGIPCSDLLQNDRWFCERLKSLGYKVTTINQDFVNQNDTKWNELSDVADLIFIGDVSQPLFNTTRNEDFCKNINATGKKVFETFGSAIKKSVNETNFTGCAFQNGMAEFGFENNECKDKKRFSISKTGYITDQFEDKEEPKILYSAAVSVNPHLSDKTINWFSAECTYKNTSTNKDERKTCPVISTSEKGVFWGLDKPKELNDYGWKIFDRTVLYIMGDYELSASYFTIPKYITLGEKFQLFVDAKENGNPMKTGEVKYTLDEKTEAMKFDANKTELWLKTDAAAESSEIEINIQTTDKLKSKVINDELKAGNLIINILTNNYIPDHKATIKAEVLSGEETALADVEYAIRDKDLNVLKEGWLNYDEGKYTDTIDTEKWGDVTLEVSASTGDDYGGSFKTVSSSTILETGKDFKITPESWFVIAGSPGKQKKTFEIKALNKNITNVKVSGSEQIKSLLRVGTIEDDIEKGGSASFEAEIDYSGAADNDYNGFINVVSDQFSADIPVNISYHTALGDFLSSETTDITQKITSGGKANKKITIKNTGPYPLGDISASAAGDLKENIKVVSKPEYLLSGKEGEIEIEISTEGLEEGKNYSDEITISSTHGSEKIEIKALVEAGSQTGGNGTDTGEDGGGDEIPQKQFPWTIVIISIIVIAAVIVGFILYRKREKLSKLKEQKEKKELMKPGEGYRTEYY